MTAKYFAIAILLALLLGACAPAATVAPTQDINAISTAAAKTVVAQISLTAESLPTPTLEPTATVTLAVSETPSLTPTFAGIIAGPGTQLLCDDAKWVADVNVPDGTPMTAGQEFLKTWRVRNAGTCTWGAGYQLAFIGGDKMGGPDAIGVPMTGPGGLANIGPNLMTPLNTGVTYKGRWKLRDPQGALFGDEVWIEIRVEASSAPPPSGGHITAFDVTPLSPTNSANVHLVGRVRWWPEFRSMRFVIPNQSPVEMPNIRQVGDQLGLPGLASVRSTSYSTRWMRPMRACAAPPFAGWS